MKTICFAITFIICTGVIAQTQELAELNTLFSGKYEFVQTKKGIEIKFLKNGELIRREFFKTSEINWDEIYFNENDGVLVFACKDFYPNCIDRSILKTKSRNQYSKTTLRVSGAEEATNAIELLKGFSGD
jgi:hypothetical protein